MIIWLSTVRPGAERADRARLPVVRMGDWWRLGGGIIPAILALSCGIIARAADIRYMAPFELGLRHCRSSEPGDTATSVDVEAPRRLSRVVSIRFDPDEAAIIEQRAKEVGLTMSAFVRQAALARPVSPFSDGAAVECLLELLTQALRRAQLASLLNAVADGPAGISQRTTTLRFTLSRA